MKKNFCKKHKKTLALLLLLFITVGYALISTTLKINGFVGLKANTWDIRWDSESIHISPGSVETTTPTTTSGDKTLSYTAALQLPGDFLEFTIDAINVGTVDGMVSINALEPVVKDGNGNPVTLPDFIHFSVTYADGIPVEQYHKLAKRIDANTPTRETYKIRIEYDIDSEENPDEDTEYILEANVPYVQADNNVISKPLWILPTGKTKDTLTTGDEICRKGECFNFIRYDGNDVVMLAEYNLKVGIIVDSLNGHKIGEYTSSDEGYGRQSSEVRGYAKEYETDMTTVKGTVAFSTTNYWTTDGYILKPEYGSSYPVEVYDVENYIGAPERDETGKPTNPNYSIAYYVEDYKSLLEEEGAIIKDARLLTYAEAIDSNIGCNIDTHRCPETSFITNTSFWLGTADYSHNAFDVFARGYFEGNFASNNFLVYNGFGVRPIIVVTKNNM